MRILANAIFSRSQKSHQARTPCMPFASATRLRTTALEYPLVRSAKLHQQKQRLCEQWIESCEAAFNLSNKIWLFECCSWTLPQYAIILAGLVLSIVAEINLLFGGGRSIQISVHKKLHQYPSFLTLNQNDNSYRTGGMGQVVAQLACFFGSRLYVRYISPLLRVAQIV